MDWNRTVNIIVDNDSWILPYGQILREKVLALDVACDVIHSYEEIRPGCLAFFLGCKSICHEKYLSLSHLNLVVHESKLPIGRGFAPVAWSVLNGANKIVFCLIEANKTIDSGKIYSQFSVPLKGHELCEELRRLQGENSIKICLDFIKHGHATDGVEQFGEGSYFPRRTPQDSKLCMDKTLLDQFNLLRVVDNNSYPAFFTHLGRKFKLIIEDMGPEHE